MQITDHFRREEFDCHDGTKYPEGMIQMRLRPLCEVLEEIRLDVKSPIHISSGYRTSDYNKLIGGARFSQHMAGRAADIWVDNMSASALQDRIRRLYDSGHIHIGGLGWYPTFVHIDIRMGTRLITWMGNRRSN